MINTARKQDREAILSHLVSQYENLKALMLMADLTFVDLDRELYKRKAAKAKDSQDIEQIRF